MNALVTGQGSMEQNAPTTQSRSFLMNAILYGIGMFTPMVLIPLMMLLFALLFGFVSVFLANIAHSGTVAAVMIYIWILTSMGIPFFLLCSFHAWILQLNPRFRFQIMMLLNVQMLPAIFIIAFFILGRMDTGFPQTKTHVEEIIAFCFMFIFTFFASILAAFNPIHRMIAFKRKGQTAG